MNRGMFCEMKNETLIAGLKNLVQRERRTQAKCLLYLNEVDRRLLFAERGYSSLFRFVVEELGFSESSALKRIQVARLAQRFHQIYPLVEEGELSLTALMKLAPHLRQYNFQRLIDSCKKKSVKQVEAILASEFPLPERPDSEKALANGRISFTFTSDEEFKKLLEEAKTRLSHKFPESKTGDILKFALQSLLEKKEKTCRKPIPARVEANTKHIPQAVKDLVWERDGGKCTYLSPDGRKCESAHFVEFDHIIPRALGGRSDNPENLRLLCRTHNRLMANGVFGQAFIEKKIKERSRSEEEWGDMNQFRLGVVFAGGMENYKRLMNKGFV